MNKKESIPHLSQLGNDLLKLSGYQLFLTLFLPFCSFGLYFIFSSLGFWTLAVISLVLFSFFTYGSTSHDLVHMNLGLKKPANEFLLFLLELLSLRSGHAYRMAHLHHHATFPSEHDIEGAASSMSFVRTLLEGIVFQPKIWIWALKNCKRSKEKKLILFEGVGCMLIILVALALIPITPIFAIYVLLVIMGSWIIPLITSYIPHHPEGATILHQTKLFRGGFFSLIAMEHLYHLEHHLYPAVPYKNWPKLAKRLDPYFKEKNIQPIKILF